SDLKKTCFEGDSGLVACVIPPLYVHQYNKSDHEITLVNGSLIQGFSAEKPSRLRGPQFHGALAEELAGWNDGKERKSVDKDNAEETWDMLTFGVRLGHKAQIVVTTTPKPTRLIKRLLKETEG